MRLRVEFTTEPFDLDQAPDHALVAREVVQTAPLDSVDVGPFGNTAEGDAEQVLGVVDSLLRRSLEAGATRISLQLNVVDAAGSGTAPGGEGGSSRPGDGGSPSGTPRGSA